MCFAILLLFFGTTKKHIGEQFKHVQIVILCLWSHCDLLSECWFFTYSTICKFTFYLIFNLHCMPELLFLHSTLAIYWTNNKDQAGCGFLAPTWQILFSCISLAYCSHFGTRLTRIFLAFSGGFGFGQASFIFGVLGVLNCVLLR